MDGKSLLNFLEIICNSDSLPPESFLIEKMEEVIGILELEDKYRPRSSSGCLGGLLDFSDQKKTIIIVPDIHGRRNFLLKILKFEVEGKSIFDLLLQKEAIIVCVGDAIHTERKPEDRNRWIKAYEEFSSGRVVNDFMQEEMIYDVNTLLMLAELKITFPENFHFLKGNHENIDNSCSHGNRSFRKYAQEGKMVTSFILDYYSEAALHVIKCYENALPLVCLFDSVVISHAEPVKSYTRQDIIDGLTCDDVVYGLTWTGNDVAEKNSVINTCRNLKVDMQSVLWFGGHRPVPGNYLLRQNGLYIQIHNPDRMNIAVLKYGCEFNPETDIVCVDNGGGF